jgi:6-phosphogluconolactonase
MDIKIFKDESEFVAASVAKILHACETPQGTVGRVALSGGSTPKPIYEALSSQSEFIDSTEFYQVDERYVPQDHKNSNHKLITESLKPKDFYAFDTSLPIEECLSQYEEKLREMGEHTFDVSILGIGTDGHTASLFPNSDSLGENEKWTAHTTTDEHDIKDRLTLTFPPILYSKSLLVLLKGSKKRTVLERLLSGGGSTETFPALGLRKHTNLTIYFLENI